MPTMENYDIKMFFNQLRDTISNTKGLYVFPLGFAREHPILCIRPKPTIDGPRVLISGGFHGDEVSGPWGIVEYLKNNDYPTDVNLSILPLVNPTGFVLSRRRDFWGDEPNRGYMGGAKPVEKASYEDDILNKNLGILSILAKDCYMSFHEDDEENFYFYTYSGDNGKIEEKLRELGSETFGLMPEEKTRVIAGSGANYTRGSVIDEYDNSFEHAMKTKGVKKVITVEVPGLRDFNQRVNFIREVLEEICKPEYY